MSAHRCLAYLYSYSYFSVWQLSRSRSWSVNDDALQFPTVTTLIWWTQGVPVIPAPVKVDNVLRSLITLFLLIIQSPPRLDFSYINMGKGPCWDSEMDLVCLDNYCKVQRCFTLTSAALLVFMLKLYCCDTKIPTILCFDLFQVSKILFCVKIPVVQDVCCFEENYWEGGNPSRNQCAPLCSSWSSGDGS